MDCGVFIQINLGNITNQINTEQIISLNQISILLQQVSKNLDIILIVASIIFVLIAILLSLYMSRVIVYPLNRFLRSKDEEKSTEQIEMRKILLHTTEGIIAFDRDGKIALINPAARKLLKISHRLS